MLNERQKAHAAIRREEIQNYSMVRALEALAAGRTRSGCLEAEISADLERDHAASTANSLLVPLWAFQRDLNVAAAGAGGYLVDAKVEIDSLAYLLRGRSVIASLPITVFPNLRADAIVPIEVTGPTVNVLSTEASQITPSSGTFGTVALVPKTIGAVTTLSRQFALQTGPGGDRYVRNSLLRAVGQSLDQLALNGSGAAGEPYGLISQISGSVTGASLDEADVREFQTDVGAALGADCAFIATQAVASLLNGRQRFTGTDRTLWEGNVHQGELGGWPAFSTPNLPAGHLIFGAWESFVLAEWGDVIELSLNPYADFKAGKVSVRALATFDCGVSRPAAFSKATAVT